MRRCLGVAWAVALTVTAVGCGDDDSDGAPCEEICVHVRDGRVGYQECSYADVVYDPASEPRVDSLDPDPRDPQMRPYFQTANDYEVVVMGDCGG